MEEKTIEDLKKEIKDLEFKYARLEMDYKWIKDQNEELRSLLSIERKFHPHTI